MQLDEMTSKRKKHLTSWKVVRRCVMFFMTICVIPVLLFLMVTTENYMRPMRSNRFFLRPQLGYTDKAHPKMSKNMTAIGNRLERRKQFLKRACKNLGLNLHGNDTLHKPNPWEFLVNTKYRLIWCNIFKAASSSWMYNFNILAGYSPDFLKKTKQVALNLARQKYPRQSIESLRKAFNGSLSFLIVRHPLERLLSGYRDKIEHALPHSLHKKLGNQIIMKYRPLTVTGKSRRTKVPTFEEFVLYLLDCVKNGESLDMHWTPIVEFCTPCMFNFDIVAHTETLQEDQEYLIYKAGLQDIIKPEWKNSGKGMTAQQVDKYYSQLTRAQILQLYHIYRYDFELFNYTLTGYLNVGIMDKDPAALLDAINMKDLTRKSNRVVR
ncbi:hypothetical protein Trydic_g9383 [Trypoxylus dichotomus]